MARYTVGKKKQTSAAKGFRPKRQMEMSLSKNSYQSISILKYSYTRRLRVMQKRNAEITLQNAKLRMERSQMENELSYRKNVHRFIVPKVSRSHEVIANKLVALVQHFVSQSQLVKAVLDEDDMPDLMEKLESLERYIVSENRSNESNNDSGAAKNMAATSGGANRQPFDRSPPMECIEEAHEPSRMSAATPYTSMTEILEASRQLLRSSQLLRQDEEVPSTENTQVTSTPYVAPPCGKTNAAQITPTSHEQGEATNPSSPSPRIAVRRRNVSLLKSTLLGDAVRGKRSRDLDVLQEQGVSADCSMEYATAAPQEDEEEGLRSASVSPTQMNKENTATTTAPPSVSECYTKSREAISGREQASDDDSEFDAPISAIPNHVLMRRSNDSSASPLTGFVTKRRRVLSSPDTTPGNVNHSDGTESISHVTVSRGSRISAGMSMDSPFNFTTTKKKRVVKRRQVRRPAVSSEVDSSASFGGDRQQETDAHAQAPRTRLSVVSLSKYNNNDKDDDNNGSTTIISPNVTQTDQSSSSSDGNSTGEGSADVAQVPIVTTKAPNGVGRVFWLGIKPTDAVPLVPSSTTDDNNSAPRSSIAPARDTREPKRRTVRFEQRDTDTSCEMDQNGQSNTTTEHSRAATNIQADKSNDQEKEHASTSEYPKWTEADLDKMAEEASADTRRRRTTRSSANNFLRRQSDQQSSKGRKSRKKSASSSSSSNPRRAKTVDDKHPSFIPLKNGSTSNNTDNYSKKNNNVSRDPDKKRTDNKSKAAIGSAHYSNRQSQSRSARLPNDDNDVVEEISSVTPVPALSRDLPAVAVSSCDNNALSSADGDNEIRKDIADAIGLTPSIVYSNYGLDPETPEPSNDDYRHQQQKGARNRTISKKRNATPKLTSRPGTPNISFEPQGDADQKPRRTRSVVSYREPSLIKKMRREK